MEIVKKNLKIGESEGLLTGYILDNFSEIDPARRRPAILICPGGAYGWVSVREGEPVAIKFAAMGFQSFVLQYPCAPVVRYPYELAYAMKAMKEIRDNASEWHVDGGKIAVMGFSAGGHLAANLSCDFNNEEAGRLAGVKANEARPDASLLCYPVITSGEFAHRGSFDNLLGENATPELLRKLSLENAVTDSNPPTFMWHTFADGAVPVQNSLLYAMALKKAGVPCELHIFPFGGHGLSLATHETEKDQTAVMPLECAEWPTLCGAFLKRIYGISD